LHFCVILIGGAVLCCDTVTRRLVNHTLCV